MTITATSPSPLYATLADARAEGAVGDDPAVEEALRRATATIDRVTGRWWGLRDATAVVQVDSPGTARLPRHLVTVTALRYPGVGEVYALERVRILGDGLTVHLGVLPARWPPFGLTAEVVGTWGAGDVPPAVREAAAVLAAHTTGADVGGEGGAVNAEGDADLTTPAIVPVPTILGTARSTGVARADALLLPYLPPKVRVG